VESSGDVGDCKPSNISSMRYRSLDLWRGLAALLVVVFHAFGNFPGAQFGDFHPAVGAFWMVGGNGWLGVHIFFAVSGYCIAAAVDSGLSRDASVAQFLRDRALRIYPTYWMALVFLMAVGAATAPFIGKSPVSALPQSWATFLPDVFLVQPLFTDRFFLLVSWSLAYELCFYALCGLGMLMLRAGWPTSLVLGLGASLAAIGFMLPAGSFPVGLWPEFYLGVLSYAFLRSRRSGNSAAAWLSLGAGSVLVAAGFYTKSSYQLAMFATASVTALGIALLYSWDRQISAFRWLKPLAYLGVISYSLYLVHLIVVSKVMNLSKRFVSDESFWVLPVVLLASAAAIITGAFFYRVVEAPFETWRKGLRAR
jgi:peptidoglycan/LPS O-acetylase OafA/YrhL